MTARPPDAPRVNVSTTDTRVATYRLIAITNDLRGMGAMASSGEPRPRFAAAPPWCSCGSRPRMPAH